MKTPSSKQFSNPLLRKAGQLTLAVAVAAALAACGGGGGGGDASPTQNTEQSTPNENTNTGNPGTDNPPQTHTIAPLPVGTGIASFSWGTVGEFVRVDGSTGAVTKMSNPCGTTYQGFTGIDTRPDGVVVGVTSEHLHLVDMVTGECEQLATPPVPMGVVAVAADGKIHTVSLNANDNGKFVLYVLDAAGSVLSSAELTGTNLDFIKGIDFAPDGKLYMSAHDAMLGYQIFEIDPTTGNTTARFATSLLAGDIDIDSTGKLRSSSTNQTIYTIDISNGAVVGALPTDRVTEHLMVYR